MLSTSAEEVITTLEEIAQPSLSRWAEEIEHNARWRAALAFGSRFSVPDW